MSQPVNGYIIQAEGSLWLAAIDILKNAEVTRVAGYNVYPVEGGIPEDFLGQPAGHVANLLHGDYVYEGHIDLGVVDGIVSLQGGSDCHPVRWARNDVMLADLPHHERALIEGVQAHALIVSGKRSDPANQGPDL